MHWWVSSLSLRETCVTWSAPNPFDFEHLTLLSSAIKALSSQPSPQATELHFLCLFVVSFLPFWLIGTFLHRNPLFIYILWKWEELLAVTRMDSRRVHGHQKKTLSSSTTFRLMDQAIGDPYLKVLVCYFSLPFHYYLPITHCFVIGKISHTNLEDIIFVSKRCKCCNIYQIVLTKYCLGWPWVWETPFLFILTCFQHIQGFLVLSNLLLLFTNIYIWLRYLLIGLQRCGKSCRLRWTNYLRPDIKRGRFSLEEEDTIIQLHSIMGNK